MIIYLHGSLHHAYRPRSSKLLVPFLHSLPNGDTCSLSVFCLRLWPSILLAGMLCGRSELSGGILSGSSISLIPQEKVKPSFEGDELR